MEKIVSGVRAYTEAERERDAQAQREVLARDHNRRKAKRQNYNRPATRGHLRNYQRMVGERE